jgi:hypothetical protein
MVEESFFRAPERGREHRTLRADTYRLAFLLLKNSPTACLFVPIRRMQYLAVVDREEFIFVDREGGRVIELAWQAFAPQVRDSLEAPVPYELVYYTERSPQVMSWLPMEFHRALCELVRKQPVAQMGDLVLFPGGRR